MKKLTGVVRVRGRPALVSQQAWIFNSTLRENILFGLPYNKERYSEAVKYEKEMQRLIQEIEAKYLKQIAELTALMNKRVEEAAEHARQVALRDLETKVVEATETERKRGEKLLDAERRKSEAAVEREKVKMRKLAKALFEREKKLNTLDKDISSALDSASSSSIKSSMSGSKTNPSNFKVDTIRKF